jgi:hypothetical protein
MTAALMFQAQRDAFEIRRLHFRSWIELRLREAGIDDSVELLQIVARVERGEA